MWTRIEGKLCRSMRVEAYMKMGEGSAETSKRDLRMRAMTMMLQLGEGFDEVSKSDLATHLDYMISQWKVSHGTKI